MEIIKINTKERNRKMLKTLDTVYIYIVRFNKKEKVNIEVKNKAMYFRRI